MTNQYVQQSRDTYNIAHWSQGYFDIDEQGYLCVCPNAEKHKTGIRLLNLIDDIQKSGLCLPVLVRFTDILQHRLQTLHAAFNQAMKEYEYHSHYTSVYPIKVNQQQHVAQALLKHDNDHQVGLEAGSKPELMAVLGLATKHTTIICNGYKDREYIRLALIGKQLGHAVYIIVEKLSELELILQESQKLGVKPLLGVRVRLASIGAGKWQNTGGEKSKFGVSATQLLEVVKRLREAEQQDSLQLLHFHMGSQIPNIRDIHKGLREAARYFAELWRLGIKIKYVDAGGGLGVDYHGGRSRNTSSMNYSTLEYARNLVSAFQEICLAHDLPQPNIITEAGRAMTAHHAVLITNILEVEKINPQPEIKKIADDEPQIIQDLWLCFLEIEQQSLIESYHDACHFLSEAQTMYVHGLLDLEQRARAEQIYLAICIKVKTMLKYSIRAHRDVLDELNEKLADKYFCNFSLFQSLPDVWAIDQIFPVMPLSGLAQPLTQRGVVQDLTCDSDGRIDYYIDGDSLETTLPLPLPHSDQENLLGFFLVGAYQEILGDMHNLFGDTHSINVEFKTDGTYSLVEPLLGDSASEILRYVHFEPNDLVDSYRTQLANAKLTDEQRQSYLEELEDGLHGYTYLEE